MNIHDLIVRLDAIREGRQLQIQEKVSADFMEIDSEDLAFRSEIEVKGVAYLASQELVLRVSATTKAQLPCVVCNRMVEVPVIVEELYHVVPCGKVRNGIFDYSPLIRENLILTAPKFAECTGEGCCPEREVISRYLQKETPLSEETQRPFEHLNLKLPN